MKKIFAFIMLGAIALSPLMLSAAASDDNFEKNKSAAAEYLQSKMKEKVKEGADKALEKMDSKTAKLIQKAAANIENAELAASLCWDVIEFGMDTSTDQKVFAANFARRFEKYLSQEYKDAADAINSKTERLVGFRVPNESDFRTALFELGKSTYNAIQKMTPEEKQKSKQAGVSIQNFSQLMLDIGGSTGRKWKKQFEK